MQTIYHDLWIQAPVEKVFEAVTKPELLNEWWTLQCEGQPITGSVYKLIFSPEYIWHGKVTQHIHDLAFELEIVDSHPDWDGTLVGFVIKEQSNGSKLQFTHARWKKLNEHFRASSYCWAVYLRILKGFLEKGIRVPYEERDWV